MSDAPVPVRVRRPDAPAPLAALVMRCLEKEPDDRPQTAGEVVRVLDGLATGDHQGAERGTTPRQRLARTLLRYGLAFIPVAIVARALVVLGMPDWVLPAAMGAMVLLLPLVVRRGLR